MALIVLVLAGLHEFLSVALLVGALRHRLDEAEQRDQRRVQIRAIRYEHRRIARAHQRTYVLNAQLEADIEAVRDQAVKDLLVVLKREDSLVALPQSLGAVPLVHVKDVVLHVRVIKLVKGQLFRVVLQPLFVLLTTPNKVQVPPLMDVLENLQRPSHVNGPLLAQHYPDQKPSQKECPKRSSLAVIERPCA